MSRNTYSPKGIICPYCGYLHTQDLYEMHHGQEDFDAYCGRCDKAFCGTMHISVSYSTYQDGEEAE